MVSPPSVLDEDGLYDPAQSGFRPASNHASFGSRSAQGEVAVARLLTVTLRMQEIKRLLQTGYELANQRCGGQHFRRHIGNQFSRFF
jgi:hypothetical protein